MNARNGFAAIPMSMIRRVMANVKLSWVGGETPQ